MVSGYSINGKNFRNFIHARFFWNAIVQNVLQLISSFVFVYVTTKRVRTFILDNFHRQFF